MRNLQDTVQADLKRMDLLPEEAAAVQSFDVSKQVMDRVYRKAEHQPDRAVARRFRSAAAIPAMTLVVVMGLAVTGYAGSQYIEFRDSKGEVVMNTGKAGATSAEYTQLLSTYVQQVQDRLQPGEFAAYYVKDDFIEGMDQANPVKFAYKEERMTSFDGLLDEIKRTEAPALQVASLPGAFSFDYGYVYPADMYPELLGDANYRALEKSLVQQSESAEADDKVFLQKLDWERADFTLAQYSKGTDRITITVRATHPDTTLTTVIQNDTDSSEKVAIGGAEAYYIKLGETSRESFERNQRLGWIDGTSGLFYEIYDNKGSRLTKDDLLKVAEYVMTQQ